VFLAERTSAENRDLDWRSVPLCVVRRSHGFEFASDDQ
jgi:hypothetical protein